MEQLAVKMQRITKIFGGVKANDAVDFSLRQGSIHGLLGENGAGKTTLMNILYVFAMTQAVNPKRSTKPTESRRIFHLR